MYCYCNSSCEHIFISFYSILLAWIYFLHALNPKGLDALLRGRQPNLLARFEMGISWSHNIITAPAQILLARQSSKTEIIHQTGAGIHGVATAT